MNHDFEPATCVALDDGTDEFDGDGFFQQRLEELAEPAAGAVAVGGGDRLPGLAYRSAIAAVVRGVDDVALAPQMPAAEMGLVQLFQQVIEICCRFGEFVCLVERARADTLPAASLHDGLAGGFIHGLI